MTPRHIEAVVLELCARLSGHAPSLAVVEQIREAIIDNGLDVHPRAWLTDIFEAVLAGREVAPAVTFPRDNGDVASFWKSASQVVPGWGYDDQGESLAMAFPGIGVRVHVSREARNAEGQHCYSYKITRLSPSQ